MVNLLNLLKEGKEEEVKKKLEEKTKQLEEKIEELNNQLQECKQEELKSKIRGLIIKRYSNYINEKEIKTIDELKSLVQPQNQVIQQLIKNFQAETKEEKIKKAYEFVAKQITSLPSVGVNFWMTIEEILENKAADYEDKAILLCSILKAMDFKAQIAIAELNDGSNKPFILIQQNEKYLMLDPNNFHEHNKYTGDIKQLAEQYFENNQRISRFLYKFDNQQYEELI